MDIVYPVKMVLLMLGAWTIVGTSLGNTTVFSDGVAYVKASVGQVWSDVQVYLMDPEESYQQLQNHCMDWEQMSSDVKLSRTCAQWRKSAIRRTQPPGRADGTKALHAPAPRGMLAYAAGLAAVAAGAMTAHKCMKMTTSR